MYVFGKASLLKYHTLNPYLQAILDEAIKVMDFTIVCGHRSNDEQHRLFNAGLSELDAGKSNHNSYPSFAVDIAPYYPTDGIRWDDIEAMCMLYGIVQGIAHMKGINIRWGGDWNKNNDRRDQNFDDVWHIELI